MLCLASASSRTAASTASQNASRVHTWPAVWLACAVKGTLRSARPLRPHEWPAAAASKAAALGSRAATAEWVKAVSSVVASARKAASLCSSDDVFFGPAPAGAEESVQGTTPEPAAAAAAAALHASSPMAARTSPKGGSARDASLLPGAAPARDEAAADLVGRTPDPVRPARDADKDTAGDSGGPDADDDELTPRSDDRPCAGAAPAAMAPSAPEFPTTIPARSSSTTHELRMSKRAAADGGPM
mmetsp:Transcript_1515/g.5971  ORF Transcript_1515/g.5971 Transcript_1515/m.5971 type:complete len:244 (-) Transcript_1515:931-1662(-)